MKKYFLSILIILSTLIFLSCDNPLFINATKLYKVSFSTNGGTTIESYRTDCVKERPYSEREEYTLEGWYLSSDFTGEMVSFPYYLTSDTTLFAHWLKEYTVSFVTNGGTEIASYKTGVIKEKPQTYREGYSLVGWYKDAELQFPVVFPYTLSTDTVLYAKWQETHTVTFETNGGTAIEPMVTGYLEEEPVTTKTDYTFVGWYSDSKLKTKIEFPYTVTSDITLYAKWKSALVAEDEPDIDYEEMVLVTGGSYYFGDPSESSRPKITLSSFQIAKYELTYELWLEVYNWAKENGYNLTQASKGYADNDMFKTHVPATNISWNMACVWLNAYSEYKGFEPVYYRGSTIWKDDTSTSNTFSWNQNKNGYRLPTECEWEFAAGGGSAEEHDKYKYAGSNTINEVAWYYSNNDKEAQSVGTKKANKLEIFDMSGNVAEFCYDRIAEFGAGELTNPIHETGTDYYGYRIVRGGGGDYSYSSSCDITKRFATSPGERKIYEQQAINNSNVFSLFGYRLGLRIARNAE